MRLLVAFALMFGLACGADTPTPEYPFPESDPLAETDLAEYLDDSDGEADEEIEEEWDDGLSDEDLQMDGGAGAQTPTEAAESGEPVESSEDVPAGG